MANRGSSSHGESFEIMAHSTPLGDKTVPMDEFWRSDGSSDNSTIDCSKLVSYSTAMKIAEKENGVIKIQSEVNEGTPVMKDLEFPTGSASKDPNREPLGSIMNRMWKRRRTNSKGPASQNQEKVSEGNVYDFHEEHSEGDQIDNNVPASNTPPEIFKRKRDPNDEEEWRAAGGHTPDEKKKRPGSNFDFLLLGTLVHLMARTRNIDLKEEPLTAAFFKKLVQTYGEVSGGQRLAPYKNYRLIQLKWAEGFCTKAMTAKGSKKSVHKYTYPQEAKIMCSSCVNDQQLPAQVRVSEVLMENMANQISASQGNNESTCRACGKSVKDQERHFRENCRLNPKNLVTCTSCGGQILKRSLKEHLDGRVNKNTGGWAIKPCHLLVGEKAKELCTKCGLTFKHLRRHTCKVNKPVSELSQPPKPSAEVGSGKETPSAHGDQNKTKRPSSVGGEKRSEVVPQEPSRSFECSQAFIDKLSDDLVMKYQQSVSRVETGGVQRDLARHEGIHFLKEVFQISAEAFQFDVEADGDCLVVSEVATANPSIGKEECQQLAIELRQAVMDEAIVKIKEMTGNQLLPIQAATAVVKGRYMTREELVEEFTQFRQSGTYNAGLGDLMPQILASFTRCPLFVIWVDKTNNQTTGHFVHPQHVFNMPEYDQLPRCVVKLYDHYEPLKLSKDSLIKLKGKYMEAKNEQVKIGAIQLPLASVAKGRTEKDRRNILKEKEGACEGVEEASSSEVGGPTLESAGEQDPSTGGIHYLYCHQAKALNLR